MNLFELVHPTAVRKIQDHVDQKANRYEPQFREGKAGSIDEYCIVGMQWMEPNAAAVWIVNWICQEMIEIHEHRRAKNQARFQFLLNWRGIGAYDWNQEMEQNVEDRPH